MVKNKTKSRKVNSSVHSLLTGQLFRPSESPPVITLSPFNRSYVRLRNTTSSWTVKVSDLAGSLQTQAGFDGAQFKNGEGFELKLHSVSVWGVGGHPNDMILVVRDPTVDAKISKSTELVRVDSMAMANQYARAGYRYPSHVSSRVIHSSLEKDLELVSCQSVLAGFELHFVVSWRGSSLKFLHDRTNVIYTSSVASLSCLDDLDMAIEDAEIRLRALELKRLKSKGEQT